MPKLSLLLGTDSFTKSLFSQNYVQKTAFLRNASISLLLITTKELKIAHNLLFGWKVEEHIFLLSYCKTW